MKEIWLGKGEQKRILKLSLDDTRPGIHNTKFHNH